jgi:hypothetical protein
LIPNAKRTKNSGLKNPKTLQKNRALQVTCSQVFGSIQAKQSVPTHSLILSEAFPIITSHPSIQNHKITITVCAYIFKIWF